MTITMSLCSLTICCCFVLILSKNGVVSRQFVDTNELTVKVLTWNINEKSPKQVDFTELLAVNGSQVPDLYAIGLQEVNPMTSITAFNENKWIKKLSNELIKFNYVILSTIGIHGSFIIVFIRKDRLKNVALVESSYDKRGPFGLLGNKGATAVRLDIDEISLCFISSHFHSGDEKLSIRIEDYHAINKDIIFVNPKTKRIVNHDLIFWFGDLNFRLEDYTASDIVDILDSQPLEQAIGKLLTKDQLKRSMKAGDVFVDYLESRPTFKPTYKYMIATNDYNLKRKPAFTDRVLYRKNLDTLHVKQIMYTANDAFKISDHKPVSALFSVSL